MSDAAPSLSAGKHAFAEEKIKILPGDANLSLIAMRSLLIATTNPSKFTEVAAELKTENIRILSLKDFPGLKIPEETGTTFEENALLKVRYYFERTGIPCLADDGGLIVDALGGAPGISSHRWLGRDASDEDLANAVLEKMKEVPREKRSARIGGFIVFYDGKHILKRENYIEGYVVDRLTSRVSPGFPYRSILMVAEFGKTYGDLTEKEHDQVNFRRKNLRELKTEILRLLHTSD